MTAPQESAERISTTSPADAESAPPAGPAAMRDLSRHGAGRFAPSPSGPLHIGNLRTALLAWLFARSTGRAFLVRLEDLDRVRPGAAVGQLRDLRALGLDHDGEVVAQSERVARYDEAIDILDEAGLTYECFCTRREIREAASAPQADGHATEGRYPGTCRDLSHLERTARRAERSPALRLRAQVDELTVVDQLRGAYTARVEDLVLRRNDGLPAYNLAVVVDDAAQGIDQIVRGDDLLPATPAQVHLADLLGLPRPSYAHVPLALNAKGQRLAKRDGAVTLDDLRQLGWSAGDVLVLIARSLGLTGSTPEQLLVEFEPSRLPLDPWIVIPSALDVQW